LFVAIQHGFKIKVYFDFGLIFGSFNKRGNPFCSNLVQCVEESLCGSVVCDFDERPDGLGSNPDKIKNNHFINCNITYDYYFN